MLHNLGISFKQINMEAFIPRCSGANLYSTKPLNTLIFLNDTFNLFHLQGSKWKLSYPRANVYLTKPLSTLFSLLWKSSIQYRSLAVSAATLYGTYFSIFCMEHLFPLQFVSQLQNTVDKTNLLFLIFTSWHYRMVTIVMIFSWITRRNLLQGCHMALLRI